MLTRFNLLNTVNDLRLAAFCDNHIEAAIQKLLIARLRLQRRALRFKPLATSHSEQEMHSNVRWIGGPPEVAFRLVTGDLLYDAWSDYEQCVEVLSPPCLWDLQSQRGDQMSDRRAHRLL